MRCAFLLQFIVRASTSRYFDAQHFSLPAAATIDSTRPQRVWSLDVERERERFTLGDQAEFVSVSQPSPDRAATPHSSRPLTSHHSVMRRAATEQNRTEQNIELLMSRCSEFAVVQLRGRHNTVRYILLFQE